MQICLEMERILMLPAHYANIDAIVEAYTTIACVCIHLLSHEHTFIPLSIHIFPPVFYISFVLFHEVVIYTVGD